MTTSKPNGKADAKAPPSSTPREQGQYTARDIQVLGGLEAVRRRPGMYIGSTDQRGLHHLVYEIADNAIDEGMAGFCDHIEVVLQADGYVTVWDNGRGIPVDVHEKTGKSALETVMTILHAGGKFGGQVYKVSGGLHGVGASVVNALSERLWAEVRRGGKAYVQEYERGIPVSDVRQESEPRYRSSGRSAGCCRRQRQRHDDLLPARPQDLRRARLRLHDARPAPARVRLPGEGRLDPPPRRARRPGADVLLRGRHPELRPAPQPRAHRPPAAAHLHREADRTARRSRRRSSTTTASRRRRSASPTPSTPSTAAAI